ncbi:MAG: hypothetical protein Q9209_003324 [Squamulea sp. 1 TL-2023]
MEIMLRVETALLWRSTVPVSSAGLWINRDMYEYQQTMSPSSGTIHSDERLTCPTMISVLFTVSNRNVTRVALVRDMMFQVSASGCYGRSTLATLKCKGINNNIEDRNGNCEFSTHAARSLGRPSMPSLRSRTSPLKFFASSSTPRAESQQDSQQAWQREYLNELRSNQPTRPSGARPPPNHRPVSDAAALDKPSRTSSATSFRPPLSLRQTSPTRILEQERCSSTSSHRQNASYSSTSDIAHQSQPVVGLDLTGAKTGSVAQAYQPGAEVRGTSSTSCTTSGMYRERGERLVEKEEARMLREALEIVDQQEEARLRSTAQLEASELIWEHQNPETTQNANVPYLYKDALRTSHVRSRSDVPVTSSPKPEEGQGEARRSASEYSDERGRSIQTSKILVPDKDRDVSLTSQTKVIEPVQGDPKTVNHSEKPQSQVSQSHILWDSPQKKAYMNLSFSLPQIKISGHRRSSGSKTRTPSDSLFSNPNDKIYEEPEETIHETRQSVPEANAAPFNPTIRNRAARTIGQPHFQSMTAPSEGIEKCSCTEVYRNPPSQSKNPSYLQNGPSQRTPYSASDHDSSPTQPGTPDVLEVRSDDIRAATSMRLKDRSPKLPSPTVVSNTKGRPIVSFDSNWTPSKTDIERQESLPQRPKSRDRGFRMPITTRSKPILPESVASAPIIPTVNVPEPPSIQIDEAPSVPSISVNTLPSFSFSAAETSSASANAKNTKPSRPLPTPQKTVAKPSVRTLQESTVETFRRAAFSPSMPARLPEQILGDFPATKKWFQEPWPSFNSAYLGQFGDHMIPIELTRTASAADGETMFDRAEAPFSIFLKWAERARSEVLSQRLYVAQASLNKLPKSLQDDLPTPELVTKTGKGDLYDASIWLGVAPTYTPLHRDPNPNLYLQLAGRKTIRLLEPNAGQSVFASVQAILGSQASSKFRGDEMMKGQEKALLEAEIWTNGTLDEKKIGGFEATLGAGESLFIPQGWWHSVKSSGSGCTGSVW